MLNTFGLWTPVITFGWQQTQHHHSCLLHFEIIQDKVWIQCDKFLPILFQLFSDNFFSFVFAYWDLNAQQEYNRV
ncbi:MAG: XisI protein [Microcystis aeruginosa W13-18]|nr:XisI protein [Microcystis aeruginosa W13-18]